MKKIIISVLCFLLISIVMGTVIPAAAENGGSEMNKEPFDFNKNILISIFWPPTSEYINDEQYKYMADAEIDWVLGAGDGIGSKTKQMKMLELCSKYGIGMCVGDDRFGGNLLNMSEKRIVSLVNEYKDVPGAYGYYMLDEPYNANTFINAYTALKKADPNGYMHLNFLPGHAYPSYEVYESQMNDWLKLCAQTGCPQEYVMYDMYPFGLAQNSISREPMMRNLESVRKVGLENNVKTAMYIQSVSQTVAFRSLNRQETLFEFNIGLAFGIKQFSYFTWFTPHNRSEPFDNGIISYQGVPNAKYEFICELDHMIHNVGKTLINLDALEVYGSSNGYGAIQLIPSDFFVKTAKKADLTLSYMKDRKTGRDYCMVVNNLFNKAQNFDLTFEEGINSLQYVSYEDGELHDLEMNGNKVSVSLDKGEAIIIAMPEGFDYSARKVKTYAPTDNLALDAQIYCTSSEGSNGWYMDRLNDGKRFKEAPDNGWCSASKDGLDTITVDLGKALNFNRIDLYPAGLNDDYGKYMPKAFTVSYSSDNENWTVLAKASGLEITDNSAPSLKFPEVSGRYIKIEITECRSKRSELCEIEIYDDDKTVPAVEIPSGTVAGLLDNDTPTPVNYKKDSNLARGKKVFVSSYPDGPGYKDWGWYPDFLTDGNENNGWTSNVKIHMGEENSTEYAIIDLGDEFNISKAEFASHGCWPKDYTVSVSSDGKTFTEIASETNDYDRFDKKENYVTEPENVHGRFIQFKATKLRSTSADGPMLQLGEVKVYGTPYLDREDAQAKIELFLNGGGDEKSDSLSAVKAALDDELMTQKKLDQLIQTMLDEAAVTLPQETEEVTDAVTAKEYDFEYFVTEAETTSPETDTETETGAETTSDETKAPDTEKTPETTGSSQSGNNGSGKTALIIGAAVLAAAVIAGAVVFLVKKKKK